MFIFSERLKAIREQRGEPPDVFAKALGIGKAMLDKLESGAAIPSIEIIQQVYDVCGIDLGKNDMGAVGERVKIIRTACKQSLADFGKLLGIKENLVAMIEGGGALPTAEVLSRIAILYQVDLNELLTGQVSPLIQVETESLRRLKHEFRSLLIPVREKVKKLSLMDSTINEVCKELDEYIKVTGKNKKQV